MEVEKIIKGQPKSFLKKIKENVDDHDEQMQILGALVRLGVVVGLVLLLLLIMLSYLWLKNLWEHHQTSRS